jgi:hypothetical protein
LTLVPIFKSVNFIKSKYQVGTYIEIRKNSSRHQYGIVSHRNLS